MNELKQKITEAPVLVSLDLRKGAGQIIAHVGASTTVGWGAVLSQVQDSGKLHPARFDSGI